MIIIYIILGTILFLVELAAGGLLIAKYYFKNMFKRLFGDNEKGSKRQYTQSRHREEQFDRTQRTPRQQEGKIFSADEGEYIDFEEIKE